MSKVLQLSNSVKEMFTKIPWVFEKGTLDSNDLLKYYKDNPVIEKLITKFDLLKLNKPISVEELVKISTKIAVKLNKREVHSDQVFLAVVKLISPGNYYLIRRQFLLDTKLVAKLNSEKDLSVEEYMELNGFLKNLTKLNAKNLLRKVVPRSDVEDKILTVLSRKYKNSIIISGSKGSGKTSISIMLASRLTENRIPNSLWGSELLSINIGAICSSFDNRDRFENLIKILIKERILKDKKTILFFDDIHILSSFGINGFTPPMRDEVVESDSVVAHLKEKNSLSKNLESYLQNLVEIDSNDNKQGNKVSFIGTINSDFSTKFMDSPLREMWEIYNISDPNYDQMYKIIQSKSKELETYYKVHISNHLLKYLMSKLTDTENSSKASIDYIINTFDSMLSLFLLRTSKDRQGDASSALKVPLSFLKHYLNDEMYLLDKDSEVNFTKLKNIDAYLGKRIIGQDEAIRSLTNAIKRSYFNIKDSDKPMASLLFLGPTGVGKSQTAKVLSMALFGENRILRLDMSDFMERHNISRLVGSPPGYVGYGEGGQLTDYVLKNPYSVILFDEIEKAHPDVLNLLLSILEEGQIVSGDNKTISFKNCVIILTSNLGAELISRMNIGFNAKGFTVENISVKERLLDNLKKNIKPEILNRLNDVVVFNILPRSKAKKIMTLELTDIQKSLKRKYSTKLIVEKDAFNYVFKLGYSTDYGVRELHRSIERNLLDKVIDVLITKGNNIPKKLVADVKDNNLKINYYEK